MAGTYLLTWSTYATRLPGDHRGFVGRVPSRDGHAIHNEPGTPFDEGGVALHDAAQRRSHAEPVFLTRDQAVICRRSFIATAARHDIRVLAGAVMAAHVHLVVNTAKDDGPRVLQLFKGAASRDLNQQSAVRRARWWTKSGSRRLLTSHGSIEGAVRYVRFDQEAPLEIFGDRAG